MIGKPSSLTRNQALNTELSYLRKHKWESCIALYTIFIAICIFVIELFSGLKILSAQNCRFIFSALAFTFFIFSVFNLPLKAMAISAVRTPIRLSICVLNLFALVNSIILKPNNWDSMTYHLPRVEHWLNLQTVGNYQTDILRQIWEPPFGDYLTLIPRTIVGSDNFDGIFSFASLIILEISIYIILRRICVNGLYQDFIVVLALTPIVVLEATTTQVDLRGSSLALASVALFLSNFRNSFLLAGLAISISAGIKITSVLPIISFMFIPVFIDKLKKYVKVKYFLISIMTFLINAPWLYRNYSNFGSITGPEFVTTDSNFSIVKLAFSPGLLVARFFSFIFSNLGLPGIGQFNGFLLTIFSPFLEFCKFFDFPSSSYWPNLNEAGFGLNEDLAPSSIFILGFLTLICFLLYKRNFKNILLLISPLLLFSFVIEWQAFISRLYVSGFAVTVIILGYILSKFESNFLMRALKIFSIFSLALSILFICFSGDRGFLRVSVLGENRNSEYFNQQPNLFSDYSALSEFIQSRGITRVDLRTTENSWEYPLWAMNKGVIFEKGLKDPQLILCIDGCSGFIYKNSLNQYLFGKTMTAFLL